MPPWKRKVPHPEIVWWCWRCYASGPVTDGGCFFCGSPDHLYGSPPREGVYGDDPLVPSFPGMRKYLADSP